MGSETVGASASTMSGSKNRGRGRSPGDVAAMVVDEAR